MHALLVVRVPCDARRIDEGRSVVGFLAEWNRKKYCYRKPGGGLLMKLGRITRAALSRATSSHAQSPRLPPPDARHRPCPQPNDGAIVAPTRSLGWSETWQSRSRPIARQWRVSAPR